MFSNSEAVAIILGFFAAVALLIGLFLLFRWLNLWYWKIDKRLEEQELTNHYLHTILKKVEKIEQMQEGKDSAEIPATPQATEEKLHENIIE